MFSIASPIRDSALHWYDPYTVSGQWYRGTTHLHTFHGPNDSIRTDPDVIVAWYRSHGYHFLNVSDHNCITRARKCYGDFVVFSGHESDCIVAIDVADRPDVSDAGADVRLERLPFWTNDIVARGGVVQIAHPKATLMDWERNLGYLESLDGVSLIELYNHRQGDYDGEIHRRNPEKYAVELWDRLLLSGKRMWPTAVDDSHDYLHRPRLASTDPIRRTWEPVENEEEQFFESGGGWMCVLAEQLTPHHLKLGMRRGSVYASQGPTFDFLGIRQGKLIVRTIASTTIRVILDGRPAAEYRRSGITLDLPPCEEHRYLRIELADEAGKQAWSAPFFVCGEGRS